MVCCKGCEIGDKEQIKEKLNGASFMSLLEYNMVTVNTFEWGLYKRQDMVFSFFALVDIPISC
jgi:hypothetical protein